MSTQHFRIWRIPFRHARPEHVPPVAMEDMFTNLIETDQSQS